MDWNLFVSTLVTIGTLGTTMWAMLRFMLRDIHRDLADLKEGQKKLERGLELCGTRLQSHEARIDAANARSDQLMSVLIDLVKNQK